MYKFSSEICFKTRIRCFNSCVNQPSIEELSNYTPDFLSHEEQEKLIQTIDSNPYNSAIHRRQQHYGIIYYHTTDDRPSIQPQDDPTQTEQTSVPLPLDSFDWLLDKLKTQGFLPPPSSTTPQDNPCEDLQILVNEYVARQGISLHFDDPRAFGDTVVGISLLAPITLTLAMPHCLSLDSARSIDDFDDEAVVTPYGDCVCHAKSVARLNGCKHTPPTLAHDLFLQPGIKCALLTTFLSLSLCLFLISLYVHCLMG